MPGLFFLGVGLAFATEHARYETVNLLVVLVCIAAGSGAVAVAVIGGFFQGRAVWVLYGGHFGYPDTRRIYIQLLHERVEYKCRVQSRIQR